MHGDESDFFRHVLYYKLNLIKVPWGLLGPQRTLTADIFVIGYVFLVVKSLSHLGSEKTPQHL